jgi:hypothetical protein
MRRVPLWPLLLWSFFGRAARRLSGVSLALGLALMAIGGSGCDTYHYYDMDLQFSSSFGGITVAGMAQNCVVTISGADSHTFSLPNCSINTDNSNYPDVGTFEFATFADSGTLAFTVNAYNGTPYTPACLFGVGTASVPASSQLTTKGMITIEKMGTGCGQ